MASRRITVCAALAVVAFMLAAAAPATEAARPMLTSSRLLAGVTPGPSTLSAIANNNAQAAITAAVDDGSPLATRMATNAAAGNAAMTAYGGSAALPYMAAPGSVFGAGYAAYPLRRRA